ncbi:MAG: hypothetical protein ABW061_28190 [Polyangiaceae bacterium]
MQASSTHSCESCGMPIETGQYCAHCVDAQGNLQGFEERFERMVQWQLRQKPNLARAQAERETLAYMQKMPAWQNHPRVSAG